MLQKDAQRATDIAARFSGEEFAVMLSETDNAYAFTDSIGLATITPTPGMTLEFSNARRTVRSIWLRILDRPRG